MRIEECPVRAAVEVIGGKWKPMILRELKDGPRRFGQLRRAISGVRHKVLAEQLQQLQREGVLSKKTNDGRILQTEYDLSEYGTTLRPVLEALADWGIEHMERKRSRSTLMPASSSRG